MFFRWLKAQGAEGENAEVMFADLSNKKRAEQAELGNPMGVEKSQEEVIANFSGYLVFSNDDAGMKRLLVELSQKQRNAILQWIVDCITFLKEKLKGNHQMTWELKRLETRYVQMLKEAKNNPTEENGGEDWSVARNRSVAKRKKSYYNEYVTNVMQWANSVTTQIGDVKLFNDKGKSFVLNMATDEGYVELARGNYTEVLAEYEQLYAQKDKSLHGYLKEVRSTERGDFRNLQPNEKRGNDNRNSGQIGTEELRTNTTRNYEYLRSGNKGKSIDNEADLSESAFSMQENSDYSLDVDEVTEKRDFTQDMETLFKEFQEGVIDKEEYELRRDELFKKAGEVYGTKKQGESVTGKENFDNPVPKSVKKNTEVRTHVRTILEGGELTEDMLGVTKERILSEKNYNLLNLPFEEEAYNFLLSIYMLTNGY